MSEILFLLDEVSDEVATAEQSSRIEFNPMFSQFETVRDYCTLFLSSTVSFNYKNELKLFAFLLPMEYVFEDFIFGFMEKEMSGILDIKSQSQSKYLAKYYDNNNQSGKDIFQLKLDLLVKNKTNGKTFIADTKYKIVYEKNKVSQSDMYQMISYAIRHEVSDIKLLYPNNLDENKKNNEIGDFNVVDEFSKTDINVNAYQVPIIFEDLFDNDERDKYKNKALREIFKSTTDSLKNNLEIIFD